MSKSRWIQFEEYPRSVRTKAWRVVGVRSGTKLGEIRWYSQWRRYCFFRDHIDIPFGSVGAVFDAECLRDLADFAEARTREHKAALAAVRGER